MNSTIRALLALTLLFGGISTVAQQPLPAKGPPAAAQMPKGVNQRPRGHKDAPDLPKRIADSWRKHSIRLQLLPQTTAPNYDCRTLGLVTPVEDQGQCGSCWDFSGCETCESALIKAGYGKADGSFVLSPQFVLDCGQNGGCGGDDASTVVIQCIQSGLVTVAQYGPYMGAPGPCKQTPAMKLYKVADFGYAGSQNGVAPVQSIKNAIVAYGPVSSAVAAGDGVTQRDWDNYTGGVYAGASYTAVDHDVQIVGWQDNPSVSGGGYWIVRNSWGTDWGNAGYIWLPYNYCQIGTSALWVSATPLPAPPVTVLANPQTLTVPAGGTLAVTLTGSPTGSTVAVATQPVNGALTGTVPNLTYTPKSGFSGPDSFTFTASSGGATSNPATVSITVGAPSSVAYTVTSPKGDSFTLPPGWTVTQSPAATTIDANVLGDVLKLIADEALGASVETIIADWEKILADVIANGKAKRAGKSGTTGPVAPGTSSPNPPASPPKTGWGTQRSNELSEIRRSIVQSGERMDAAWNAYLKAKQRWQ